MHQKKKNTEREELPETFSDKDPGKTFGKGVVPGSNPEALSGTQDAALLRGVLGLPGVLAGAEDASSEVAPKVSSPQSPSPEQLDEVPPEVVQRWICQADRAALRVALIDIADRLAQ